VLNAYTILVRKPQENRPLRHRWKGNIEMNLRGCGLDSCASGQGPVAGDFMHYNEPLYCVKPGIVLRI
jgi:hypothetical protein